ncbi:MAG: nucleotidyltransferase family protein [Succinivibrio sp.]|nr:nucleotidyltransferase family protein [Succinivibrio sp.]MDY4993263.1 nucleotidyltransferase family protein [Succinivibrio sp.]MDY5904114.1 nucleotidyltransferase family protein [Succinivibrio sp.]
MKAMILAAGRGERLRPITDTCPKPLVKVGGKELLVWHIEKLKQVGITDILINSAYLSEKIVDFIGDGSKFGVKVTHSVEGASGLETAGGIIKALPFFEGQDFLVVNGDTFIDADYKQFLEPLETEYLARLYLVDNPPHNQKGDFKIEDGKCYRGSDYTFSGTAVYKTKAFLNMPIEKKPLLPLFLKWSQIHELSAKPLCGKWFDVGTIERLNQVNSYIQNLN